MHPATDFYLIPPVDSKPGIAMGLCFLHDFTVRRSASFRNKGENIS